MKILENNIAVLADDTHISKWVELGGRLDHDQGSLPIILPYVPTSGTVFDVGAFIGDHTLAYANKVGRIGEVHAFEPSAPAFECLLHNMKGLPQVIVNNAALGADDRHVTMSTLANGNEGMNYVGASNNEMHSIEQVSLDSYADQCELDHVDFIKIDVEGYELEVLKGAHRIIHKYKPYIVLEINHGALERRGVEYHEVVQFLKERGYDYDFLQPLHTFDMPQCDLIFKYNLPPGN